jgi:hypothetical protein
MAEESNNSQENQHSASALEDFSRRARRSRRKGGQQAPFAQGIYGKDKHGAEDDPLRSNPLWVTHFSSDESKFAHSRGGGVVISLACIGHGDEGRRQTSATTRHSSGEF